MLPARKVGTEAGGAGFESTSERSNTFDLLLPPSLTPSIIIPTIMADNENKDVLSGTGVSLRS